MDNHFQKNLHILRRREHRGCFVCGSANERGLRAEFVASDDGSVSAELLCDEAFRGYPGWLHGGLASALLDGAMCNCLFAHGKVGATGELSIRFRHSVAGDRRITVTAWLTRSHPPLHLLRAELSQGGTVLVEATGKFMEQPASGSSETGGV